jgi:hypothetical protein
VLETNIQNFITVHMLSHSPRGAFFFARKYT